MKLKLQSTSIFFVGMLLFSACSEQKTGKAPEKMVEDLTADLDDIVADTIPADTVLNESVKLPPPPAPLPPDPGPEPDPDPWPPEPDPRPWPPDPWPDPIPIADPEPNPIMDFAEVEPVFPGDSYSDHTNLLKFISENIQYPQIDKEQGNQGKVYVEFVVEIDGSLTNIKVLRGISEAIDREAIRVVKLMPKWIPGQSQGKAVRCRTRLPITFRLD